MKVLIIYATRGGASRECAQILHDRICSSFDVSVFDIENSPPSPDGYDVAVIGGSIRMTKINKKLKKYLAENAEMLNKIQTAIFLCCGFPENFEDYVALQIPKSVIPTLGMHCFGGELKPQKLKGIDKIIVKMLREDIKGADFEASFSDKSPLPEIVPENIYRLADKIRKLL